MNNKFFNSVFAPPLQRAGVALMAIVLLTATARGQYVSTAISNVLNSPYGVTSDNNNNLYIADSGDNQIVKYSPGTQIASTLAAGITNPSGIVYASGRGGLVVVDQSDEVLKFVSLNGSTVTNLAGTFGVYGTNDGAALSNATFMNPAGIAVGQDNTTLYIADQGSGAIRMLSTNNIVSTVATTYIYNSTTNHFNRPAAVAVDNNNNLWIADSWNHVICIITNGTSTAYAVAGAYRTSGTNDGVAASARFNLPSGLYWDNSKQILVIADTDNATIRGLVLTNNPWTVETLAGISGSHGYIDGPLSTAKFNAPIGICADNYDSGYYVADSANNAIRVLQPTAPPPPAQPIPTPIIGYLTFNASTGGTGGGAQFNAINSPTAIFNNIQDLAIEQTDGTVVTYLSYGPTGSIITPPGTNTDHANVFTPADIGLLSNQVPSLNISALPALTLEVISEAPGRPNSTAVSANIEYVTANPNIVGNNGADIILSNATVGAQMYYTLNGEAPTNDGSDGSIGPVTSGTQLSLNLVSNITQLTVRAFTPGFAPSGFVSESLDISNDVGNEIGFGFATGLASSKYITAPGRTYFAPVTLSELPGTTIYTMQFDLTETSTNFAINSENWYFQSLLIKPSSNGFVVPIDPGIDLSTNGPVANGTNYTTNGLLECSWLTLPSETNLYPTPLQDLTSASLAQGYEVTENGQNEAIIGAFELPIPSVNATGNTYTLQIKRPSASTFFSGVDPGEPIGVTLQAPTNNSTGAGAINAIKQVVVTNSVSYLVGDVFPFSWFNAGEFGDNNLQNDDVVMTYEAAVGLNGSGFGYNVPLQSSDLFDAMDSANGAYNLYDANDNDINSIQTGDGVLDVNDVYVTLRRSLDTNLTWWVRNWSASGLTVSPFTNFSTFGASLPAAQVPRTNSGTPRYIGVGADIVQTGGGTMAQVPVRVTMADPTHPIRVMMLNVEIDPLDGSPPVTQTVSFTAVSNLSTPLLSSSQGPNNCAAAWLNSTVPGVSGTNILGYVNVSLPSTVNSNSAYRVHFNHFSASPNGLALFVPSIQDGLITVGNRSGSSWHDGIPDNWRLLWYGTVSNALSAANLDPDGDGANNWQEYIAGTDPTSKGSVFQFVPGSTLGSNGFTLQWSSVVNKHYTIQGSFNPVTGPWTTLVTNLAGNGQTMQWTDSNSMGKTEFYRASVY